jgi:hypothetical protein
VPQARIRLSARQIAGYVAGDLGTQEIAREAGASQVGVLLALRAAGVDTSRHRGREPKIVLPDDLVSAYRRGDLSIGDVAGAVGCSYSGARHRLIRAGVPLRRPGDLAGRRRRGPNPDLRRDAYLGRLLRWLLARGYTRGQIAGILACSRETLATLLRQYPAA